MGNGGFAVTHASAHNEFWTLAWARRFAPLPTLQLICSPENHLSFLPVRVSISADKQTVMLDQYTRKLPVTRIPAAGGTVDFDQRFGTAAKCGPFNMQE